MLSSLCRFMCCSLMGDSRILYLGGISGISFKKDVDTGQLF